MTFLPPFTDVSFPCEWTEAGEGAVKVRMDKDQDGAASRTLKHSNQEH